MQLNRPFPGKQGRLALFLLGLVVAGCSSDNAPVQQAPAPSAIEIGVYGATVVERAGDLEFVISLTEAGTENVEVAYETSDGTAVAGADYASASGSVQFMPGETRKFVTVAVLENATAQAGSSKRMQLVLKDPRNAALHAEAGEASGVIIDRHAIAVDSAFDQNWGTAGIFTEAEECANCHDSDGALMQFSNPDLALSTDNISPSAQWKHSVMANAFNDPYWQAAVQDESESFPALSGLIEDTCTTCHAPMGRTHAHHQDPAAEYLFDTAMTENHAREGVSCTACHLMKDNGTFSGGFVISASDKDMFGPYVNPLVNPMVNNTQQNYAPAYAPHVESSAFCASCHTLYTPAIDPDTGQPSGSNTGLPSADKGFLEQGPYLEWQNSDYATGAQPVHCQDCHMPAPTPTYETPVSTMPSQTSGNPPPRRQPYAQHTLLGGNAHLLEILRDYRTELGIDGSTSIDGFNDQAALTRAFLDSAATLSLSAPRRVGDKLLFDVEVTNHAGHKLPSAYPSRRVWLHVEVRDGGGNLVFQSGKPDARGYLSIDEARLKADCMAIRKLDGFDSAVCYEPHRDVIDDPAQVAVYETVLGDVNGDITHTLLQGAQYLKDNRIPPSGFTINQAIAIEPQTVPAGVEFDADFNCPSSGEGCGQDTVHYRVDVAGKSGPYSVDVRLLYQATQPAFVDGMHTDGARVNRFKRMYDAVPPKAELLATASSP